MSRKKILFVINPKSGVHPVGTASYGVKGKTDIPALIDSYIDKNTIDHRVAFTNAAEHGIQLSREAASKEYYAVVAVGGDGSVNEVASGLIGTKTVLGIIPTGSGNGMARHLKIPMNTEKAIRVLNTGKVTGIDTFKVNDRLCIGTLGIGFDAHTAHLFANSPKRGFQTYIKLVLTEFYKYKPLDYEMKIDGVDFKKKCFLLTFANSSQYGNNARIAPFASVYDGLLDISMLAKFPLLLTPSIIYRMMNNTLHKSRYFDMKTAREIVVKNNTELRGHIDGEPVTFASDLNIKVFPLSLNVIIP